MSETVALQGAIGAMPEILPAGAVQGLPRKLPVEGLAAAKAWARLALELAGLWALNRLGYLVVGWLRVPLPGNVAGMLLLFGLLCSGAVSPRLFERSGALLSRHLAFFFVPIAVGLMDLGATVLSEGWLLVAVLVASAAAGLCVTGWIAQRLSAQKARP